MAYLSLRFDTDAAGAERWSDALLDAGALAVDVSDPAAGTPDESPLYGEPGVPGPGLWRVSRIDALFAEGTDAGRVLADTAQAIGAPMPSHETHEVADQDWVRATQSQFGPIAIGEGFWIVPSWCDLPEPGAIALELDPGLAFGTGSHPTTRLCLEWLRGAIAGGETVLDYGCGSGILAIAAAKLGARSRGGHRRRRAGARSERGERAGERRRGALRHAGPARTRRARRRRRQHPRQSADPARARARGAHEAGGRIALSGILEAQADEVAAAYARWFTLAVWRRLDGWVLLAGTRHANG